MYTIFFSISLSNLCYLWLCFFDTIPSIYSSSNTWPLYCCFMIIVSLLSIVLYTYHLLAILFSAISGPFISKHHELKVLASTSISITRKVSFMYTLHQKPKGIITLNKHNYSLDNITYLLQNR